MTNEHNDELGILEKKVAQASGDNERAEALAELAWGIKYSDPARAVELGDEVLELATKIGLESVIPKGNLSKAIGLMHMSRFKTAEKSAQAALNAYRKGSVDAGIRHALNVMGSIYFRWGKYSSALENFLESLRYHTKLSETPDPGILSNIGAVYLQLGDTDRALECATQVKKMAETMDKPADLKTAAFLNMSMVYNRMGMYDDALECLASAYEICHKNDMKQAIAATADDIGSVMTKLERYDEAMKSFTESIKVFRSLSDRKGEALVLVNMGNCSLASGGGKAMEFFLESLKLFRSMDDKQGIADSLIGVARVMRELGRMDEALNKLEEALAIAQQKNLNPQMLEIHGDLASILESEGRYDSALGHLKLFHEIDNAMRSERTANRLSSLRITHQVEKARKEAVLYKLQNIELEEDRSKLEEIVKHTGDTSEEDGNADGSVNSSGKEGGSKNSTQSISDYSIKVARIAHSLNNILTSAVGNAELVFRDKTIPEGSRKRVGTVLNSIKDGFPLMMQLSSMGDSINAKFEVSDSVTGKSEDKVNFGKIKEGSKVLLVEDDPNVAELLITTFEAYGYPVVTAASLKKARAIINESSEDIGCIFVDVMLPDGSGIDLIREVRAVISDFPVLAGSGFTLSAEDQKYIQDNRIIFVEKPYQIESLMVKISSIVPQ